MILVYLCKPKLLQGYGADEEREVSQVKTFTSLSLHDLLLYPYMILIFFLLQYA